MWGEKERGKEKRGCSETRTGGGGREDNLQKKEAVVKHYRMVPLIRKMILVLDEEVTGEL